MFRSLNSVIKKITTNPRLKKYFLYNKVQQIWKEKIDLTIQKHTEIVNVVNNTVIIQTSTPSWKTELGFQKSELLTIINNNIHPMKPIKDIRFI